MITKGCLVKVKKYYQTRGRKGARIPSGVYLTISEPYNIFGNSNLRPNVINILWDDGEIRQKLLETLEKV